MCKTEDQGRNSDLPQARCFVVSGGSFGRSIAQVVQARGGTVLRGDVQHDPFTGDWYGKGRRRV